MALSLLAMDSPFFGVFWPVIFETADRKTQDTLHLTCSYFKNMWERADAHHKSDSAKAEYKRFLELHPLPVEDQLACHSALWYSWGAGKAGFGSYGGFFDFCADAGVDPASGRLVDPEGEDLGWVFLSLDKDLTLEL